MVEQEKPTIKAVGRTVASIYNPDLLSKEQLIDSFVVRLKKFKKIFADIKSAKMETPEQHILIIGLRGMGKTTLLLRLSFEVENDDNLNNWLIPLVFNEEEYSITRLFKFWETIAKYLERKDDRFQNLFDEMDELYAQSNKRYEERAFSLLIEKLRAEKQKLLLFIDNFGDMFKRFTKEEKQRLREILTTYPDIRIIAGSAVAAESFFKYDEPFFELFKIERLEGLNKSETEHLLLELGSQLTTNPVKEILEKEPQRVETLRRLTGGIPRTIILLFEIFVDDNNGDAFTDLESILDRVTPLYKHRMDDLPPQQQEIMDAIALAWDAVPAKDIAQSTRLESKVVSAALKQMATNNLIDIQKTDKKNHLYLLHDRFFNIWYLMRMARKGDKNRVLWLIRFLEQWCSGEQLLKKTQTLIKSLIKGDYNPKGALYYSIALYYTEKNTIESRFEISKNASRFFKEKDASLHSEFLNSDIIHFGDGIKLMMKQDFESAWEQLKKIKNKEPKDYLLLSALSWYFKNTKESGTFYDKAVKRRVAYPDRVMGDIFHDYIKEYKQAEYHYLKEIDNCDDALTHKKLGWMYQEKLKDYEKAEAHYRQAIGKGETLAWVNLAYLYVSGYNDYEMAEEHYLKAAEEGHFNSLRLLGWMYQDRLKDHQKAEEFYRKAIDKGKTLAWGNLADLYCNAHKDYQKAEGYYLKAVKEGHLEDLRFLGLMYQDKLGDHEKAEAHYRKAIEKGETLAWGHLAGLYLDVHKDYKKAEEYYLKAVEEGHFNSLRLLGWMYQDKLGDHEKAEGLYRQAIDKGETFAWGNLAGLYLDVHKDYQKAEEYYLKAAEEGHFVSLIFLGLMYHYNLKNHQKAEGLYRQAIDKGETLAWEYLAGLYRDVHKDYKKAEEYYKEYQVYDKSDGLIKLGNLYDEYIDNVEIAEKYYLEAINDNSYKAMNSLAWMYFRRRIRPKKALQYAQSAYNGLGENYIAHTLATVLIWNEEFEAAKEIMKGFEYDLDYLESNYETEDYLQLLYLLLAKNQFDYLHTYFNNEQIADLQLKDRLKPIWYALLYYTQEHYKSDYLKMPPEIKETVTEIVDKVEQIRVDYSM